MSGSFIIERMANEAYGQERRRMSVIKLSHLAHVIRSLFVIFFFSYSFYCCCCWYIHWHYMLVPNARNGKLFATIFIPLIKIKIFIIIICVQCAVCSVDRSLCVSFEINNIKTCVCVCACFDGSFSFFDFPFTHRIEHPWTKWWIPFCHNHDYSLDLLNETTSRFLRKR